MPEPEQGSPQTARESPVLAGHAASHEPARGRTAAAARELLRALAHDCGVLCRRIAAAIEPVREAVRGPFTRELTSIGHRLAAVSGPLREAISDALTHDLAPVRNALSGVAATFPSRRAPTLPARDSWRKLGRFLVATAAVIVIGFAAAGGAMLWALQGLPIDRSIVPESPLLLEAVNGQPLGRIGPLAGARAERRDFPDQLVAAVLSIEDRRFFSHWGVDFRGIARALYANLAAGDVVEGGSTITQQLAKMQMVGSERTLRRKLREAFVAIWLELKLSKDEILTRYLNSIYLGAGAHGMPAAARMYFDKPLSELTLSEAALLAGLVKAPSQFNPLRNFDLAWQRAGVVLDGMVDSGAIRPEGAEQAKARPPVIKRSTRTAQAATWFADWIGKHEFPRVIGYSPQSMRVRTTLRPDLQRLAEQAVAQVLNGSVRKSKARQAALVAMRPNGEVLAMVGGRAYDESQFNRAVDARRQPGSAFKLFVYFAALREGYSLDDRLNARPIEMKHWEPENYGGREYGEVPFAEAFAKSINTAAVRLAMAVGLHKVVTAARDLGIDSPLSEVPSLALGTSEVSLFELTRAFASVRQGRMRLQPWGIAAFGPEGGELRALTPPAPSGQPIKFQRELVDLLRGVVEHGTGRAAAVNGSAAGKTGTSQNYRDAWFIGFTDQLVVGVWVGNDDSSPMKQITGGTLPAQIWKRFVVAATPALDRDVPYVADEPLEQRPAAAASNEQLRSESDPSARCNIAVCASTYRSFRALDCTYRSYAGSRRLCEINSDRNDLTWGRGNGRELPPDRGSSRAAAADRSPISEDAKLPFFPLASESGADRMPGKAASRSGEASCNYDVCSSRYQSFEPSDCTYQPYGGGPRQLCRR
jgi:1A family penicillin-binding protein